MAWYGGGNWGDVQVDRYGHMLSQMMFAVNEREDAAGRTLSTWGDLGKSYPVAHDLDGVTREDADDYLDLLQASIPSLYDVAHGMRFVQLGGSDWTEGSLFAAAGSVDHWLSLERPSGLAPYMQLRHVVENLIYLRVPAGGPTVNTYLDWRNGTADERYAPGDYSALSWADALSKTPVFGSYNATRAWRGQASSFPTYETALHGPTGYWDIPLASVVGELVHVRGTLRDWHTAVAATQTALIVTVNGTSYTAASAAGATTDQPVVLGEHTIVSGNYRFPFTVSVPTENPFTLSGESRSSRRFVSLLLSGGGDYILTRLLVGTDLTYG